MSALGHGNIIATHKLGLLRLIIDRWVEYWAKYGSLHANWQPSLSANHANYSGQGKPDTSFQNLGACWCFWANPGHTQDGNSNSLPSGLWARSEIIIFIVFSMMEISLASIKFMYICSITFLPGCVCLLWWLYVVSYRMIIALEYRCKT